MKRITITGNLGKDAECREGQGGHKFVSFSVAYAERDTDAKDEQGNPIKEAQWAECEIYVKPENSAEGIVQSAEERPFYLRGSLGQGRKRGWIKRIKPRARVILYRVTNFQV